MIGWQLDLGEELTVILRNDLTLVIFERERDERGVTVGVDTVFLDKKDTYQLLDFLVAHLPEERDTPTDEAYE